MGQVQHHARSYVCGTGGSALMHKTIGAALDDAARWMHTGDLATVDSDGYCSIVHGSHCFEGAPVGASAKAAR